MNTARERQNAKCEFCDEPAFKTNGKSELICENRANSGRCEGFSPIKSVNRERFGRKVGRNEICPCGSGIKFKKCCFTNNKI